MLDARLKSFVSIQPLHLIKPFSPINSINFIDPANLSPKPRASGLLPLSFVLLPLTFNLLPCAVRLEPHTN
jgi:hypothetical protein